ncbi:double-strand break repair protein AddB [Roseiterribacter gracilis]|uniref:Double-strand break repair protein AddB n=1 Tax=Roseiterribacter gracilis TaxID=2812848 RepID=A0A8S8XFS2_9PROT|nr:double-strand break repair protein AddB [Rhodospirillales bacterium TMPK1]
MAGGSLNVFAIPPGVGFVDVLAKGLLADHRRNPLDLAATTVLLPTRRAARSLREAFLREGDAAPLLLPRMQPLGDLDSDELLLDAESTLADLPPAISPLRRRLLLAKLVAKREPMSPDRALALADELGSLLDEAQMHEIEFAALNALVPVELAQHWQVTLEFLQIVTTHWPAILAAEGAIDPAERRRRVLDAQAEAWRVAPPPGPVIAAGTTGSIPAVARLLKVIAAMPRGAVVLDGVDLTLDEAAWNAIDDTHPQAGLQRLLQVLHVKRSDVRPWPDAPATPPRAQLWSAALRPAPTTGAWRANQFAADAVQGLTRIDCSTHEHEADTIALLFRDQLREPGKTAMLVTPDRTLARRVATAMRRWEIELDDSGGTRLGDTPVGAFLRLLADVAAQGWAPIPLLSLLKHPLAAGGTATAAFRRDARQLERDVLRGPRPGPGAEGLQRALGAESPFVTNLAQRLGAFDLLFAGGDVAIATLVEALIVAAELLAETDEDSGVARLWRGEDGEAAAATLDEMMTAARDLDPIAPDAFPSLLSAVLQSVTVRPRYGTHPRLAIYGPLEARLQSADLIVLGGLNEGTWPREASDDPWLSRGMRKALDLPLPERRIGQAAHDVATLACAPRVVLTRGERVDARPSVPSRWLQRLDAALAAADQHVPRDLPHARWVSLLDLPDAVVPCAQPAPRPPVALRPRSLSVTEIETWMRDPYAIYARHVLKLTALHEIDEEPGAADRGQFVHDALDRFVATYPDSLPPDALPQLLAMGRDAFGDALARPLVWGFWWPRFERVARWFITAETERRAAGARPRKTEVKGTLTLSASYGDFVLRARADRVDSIGGGIGIVDYKTGRAPPGTEIGTGFAPQLPLEAAIARAGGFKDVPAATVVELAFWRLAGGNPPGEIVTIDGDLDALADAARDGLLQLIERFDRQDTPYLSQPIPSKRPRFSDYAHLARVLEWSGEGAPE